MNTHLLSFGLGYTARGFVSGLPDGWQVTGTSRSGHDPDTLQWPGTDLTPHIAKADALLVSVAPGAAGCPVLGAFQDEIRARAPQLQWVGYLSTTGVYGDHGGGWVDENSPLNPATERGHWRVAAEQAWQSLAATAKLPLHIFRLAGIYGPGRGPFAKLRSGTARRIIKENQVFSRAHVEDIAQVLHASFRAPAPGGIYNVCDDDPAPPQDVLAEAARLLGRPVPPPEAFDTAEMSPMARSFYAENKRVSNARIKSQLGIQLKFPNYKNGLADLLARENPKA